MNYSITEKRDKEKEVNGSHEMSVSEIRSLLSAWV